MFIDSGKVGGRNDDLVISLQLALTGSRVFYTENRYRTFRPVYAGHSEHYTRTPILMLACLILLLHR